MSLSAEVLRHARYSNPMTLVDPQSLLRQAGMRATKPRTQVLAALAREVRPRPASFIAQKLRGSVDPVTVYRTLESLVEAKVLTLTDFRHGHGEYELTSGRAHHHHVVCTRCGTVEDVLLCSARELERRTLARTKKFVAIDSHMLEFFGVCARCA